MRNAFLILALTIFSVAQAADLTGTLKQIDKTGEFRIGYRENTPPFSFHDEYGAPVGYSVELCRRIGAAIKEELGLKELNTQFIPISMEDRFTAVDRGEVDILCGSTTVTLERMEQVDFTLMTFLTGGSLLSTSPDGIKTTAELTGKKAAIVKGASTAPALAKYIEDSLIDAELIEAESLEAAMDMLDQGKVDAVADDQIVLIGQILDSKDPAAHMLSQDLYSFEPYALVVKRDDAAFRLVANRALAKLYRTGQYKQLYERWFGRFGVRPSPILAAMFELQALPE